MSISKMGPVTPLAAKVVDINTSRPGTKIVTVSLVNKPQDRLLTRTGPISGNRPDDLTAGALVSVAPGRQRGTFVFLGRLDSIPEPVQTEDIKTPVLPIEVKPEPITAARQAIPSHSNEDFPAPIECVIKLGMMLEDSHHNNCYEVAQGQPGKILGKKLYLPEQFLSENARRARDEGLQVIDLGVFNAEDKGNYCCTLEFAEAAKELLAHLIEEIPFNNCSVRAVRIFTGDDALIEKVKPYIYGQSRDHIPLIVSMPTASMTIEAVYFATKEEADGYAGDIGKAVGIFCALVPDFDPWRATTPLDLVKALIKLPLKAIRA